MENRKILSFLHGHYWKLILILVTVVISLGAFQYIFINKYIDSATSKSNELNQDDDLTPYFILEKYFPTTRNYFVQPDPETDYEFLIRANSSFIKLDTLTGAKEVYDLKEILPGIEIGSYLHIDDLIFFSSLEGVYVYDISSKKIDIYTEADGLPSKHNIKFHPDPYQENILWIGTFRGLSKFDLTTRTFKNYSREIGLSGSRWEPRVFYIDEKALWVTIGANAYNPGGVAKLDKFTDQWKVWSTETFNNGITPNERVDVYIHEGSPKYIIIEEDGNQYVFDRIVQKWSLLRENPQAASWQTGLAIIDEWVYSVNRHFGELGELHGYNFITKESVVINYLNLYNEATGDDIDYVDIMFDKNHNRFLIREKQWGKYLPIVQFRMNEGRIADVKSFSLESYYSQFEYTDVTILDVVDNDMLFKTADEIVIYDIKEKKPKITWNLEEILEGGWDTAIKLYPEHVAFHVANYCDGMCLEDADYYATTTIFDRTTGKSVLKVPFYNDVSHWEMDWDENDVKGTLRLTWATDIHTDTYTLTLSNPVYVYTRGEPVPHLYKKDENLFVNIDDSNSSLQYKKEPGLNDIPNQLLIKSVNKLGVEEIHKVSLQGYVNRDGDVGKYKVFDTHYQAPYAWFLTNQGVVQFDERLNKGVVFTSKNGLSPHGFPVTYKGQLYFEDRIVIDDNFGVGIYEYLHPNALLDD